MPDSHCITEWYPENYLFPEKACASYGILILNTFIASDLKEQLVEIWNKAIVRVTVDGGTNRWTNFLKENSVNNAKDIHLITGDFDSINKDLLCFYKNSKTTKVVETMNQDETDFTKALKELKIYLNQNCLEIELLIVLADSVGRIDQIMANIHTLHKATIENILPNIKIVQMGHLSLMWVLEKGCHKIAVPQKAILHQNWCSLVPIGSPCIVTTKGLKWNLDKFQLEFGKLISTSNTYNGEDTVFIETENFVLWSMGIKHLRD